MRPLLGFAWVLTSFVVTVAGEALTAVPPYVNLGTVDAVRALLDRQLPGSSSHFALELASTCPGTEPPCFSLDDGDAGMVKVTATGAAELASGVGYYLREKCNMTIGWKRGGGSNLFIPKHWPTIGTSVAMKRNTPWSYMMNVCTHSYSLVWYRWGEWQDFLDWMALSGINLFLGMTGQEEIQYKVFRKFGLNDTEIRNWFNGPALLTWSRGQNEYGADIAGPLPRSWMKHQWALMRNITQRYRSLGMSSQLPGFQGNVPVQLKRIQNDTNITVAGATGWMNSVDPLYGKIADEWMKTLIADFGTDHWYQLDGYFDGGTAPWLQDRLHAADERVPSSMAPPSSLPYEAPPACEWGPLTLDTYSKDCPDDGCGQFDTMEKAKAACVEDLGCAAITGHDATGKSWTKRHGTELLKSPVGEISYLITNAAECHPPPPPTPPSDDPSWTARGVAAYSGLNRTDPEAIWSFQGWAFVGWNTEKQRDSLKSFIDATPAGKFNVVDMSVNGDGEWKKWNNGTGLWGSGDNAQYIWTTLHDFGATDGLKGDLGRINHIPFDGFEAKTNVWGTGFTPEGIDQNPVYYEFMLEQNWREAPVEDITGHITLRSHRRYNNPMPQLGMAWDLLVQSAYSQDLSVQDGTGVAHLGSKEAWSFGADNLTPSATMCQIFRAWEMLIEAAPSIEPTEPFRYDLINTGREVLAQFAGPVGANFSTAIGRKSMDPVEVQATGELYHKVLMDLDTLVATDTAFQLGPWLEMAIAFAAEIGQEDCLPADPGFPTITTCAHFYEWNARTQLTTWNPTAKDKLIPDGPIDYAAKHWSGLIRDYYARRVTLVMEQALLDATLGVPLDTDQVDILKAELAHSWTTSMAPYPTEPVGDFVAVSQAMHLKYKHIFASCE